jgi:Right handed beta helix region/Bacterial Ig domain
MVLVRTLVLVVVALLVFSASASGHRSGWKVKQNIKAGQPLYGTFQWTVTKTTSTRMASVSFRVDGTQRCLDTASPWACALDTRTLANGQHTFVVRATAGDGHTTSDSDVATVTNATSPPPPPPPPPPSEAGCTDIASAGSDLSTFLASLTNNDVGCLRGGEYRDRCEVGWTLDAANRATIQSYPGEVAILHSSLRLDGDNLTARRLRVTGIAASCGGDMSGFTVTGANDVIEFNVIRGDGRVAINPAGDISRHGVLTGTASRNTRIHGNLIEGVGSECHLDHGIYFQRSGRITRNVIKEIPCGNGIHLYDSPSNVLVAQNTTVRSHIRSGILVRTTGGNITVVNNISAFNGVSPALEEYGIRIEACGAGGCVVDNNITWQNESGSIGGALARLATNTRNVDPRFADAEYRVTASSPATDTARSAFSYFPDRDGVSTQQGAGPDLGAYEQ